MSTTVVDFKPSDENRQCIIEILERNLQLAKDGQIKDIAIATVEIKADGPIIATEYHGQCQFAVLLGAVSVLQQDLISGLVRHDKYDSD